MMGDIFYKNADLTIAAMGVTFERGSFVDFLPSIKHYYMELYISKDSQAHAVDFHLLLSPFAQDSWILIIFTSVIIALVKLGILKLYGTVKSHIEFPKGSSLMFTCSIWLRLVTSRASIMTIFAWTL